MNANHNNTAYYDWSNAELRAGLLSNNSVNRLTNFRKTWYEQRWLGLENAVNALIVDDENMTNQIYIDLYQNITTEWDKLINVKSPLDKQQNKWELVNVSDIFSV